MNIRLGLEQYLDDWIAIRGGYRYGANFTWDYDRSDLSDLTGSANYSAWTAGAGVKYDLDQDSFVRSILLDYAAEYRDVGNNDWQHVVSLSAPFDLCA
jgi:opacity protein-like surface antigen